MRFDFDKWLDRGARLWLLIRPLPHNRIALVTIAVGAAVLLTPVWEPIAFAVAAHFGLQVTGTPPYWVGLILVLGALIYHAVVTALNKPQATYANGHDLTVAEQIRDALQPDRLIQIAESVAASHRYRSSQMGLLEGFIRYVEAPGNEFVDLEARSAASEAVRLLRAFSMFLAEHFSVFPDRQAEGADWRFAMYPDLNWDTGHPTPDQDRAYRERANELLDLSDQVDAALKGLQRTLIERIHSRRRPAP